VTERELSVTTEGAPVGARRAHVVRDGGSPEIDLVAVEEALEIQIDGRSLAVTMRTPGHDRELAAGFLYSEGVIDCIEDLECVEEPRPAGSDLVTLNEGDDGALLGAARISVRLSGELDAKRFESAHREIRATAACGVCGKQSLDDLCQELLVIEPLSCPLDFLRSLPDRMREQQELFEMTGGIHAAALFDPDGKLLCLREDVGRHNAVDKVIGHALLAGELPLQGRILAVSGRAGFELVQKALRAGAPVMVAVGAASSLAVQMATHAGLALYSFMRPGRGNLHVSSPRGG
jgi:FdhD protein